jgi:hypothetical protein
MAQTKRKRKSKHRGTAAGTIQARGRTGRPPSPEERKKADRMSAREARMMRPPSWKSAGTKAAAMAGLLFVFTQIGLFGQNTTIAQSLFLCLVALALYTPLAFATDKWVYERNQKRRAQRK